MTVGLLRDKKPKHENGSGSIETIASDLPTSLLAPEEDRPLSNRSQYAAPAAACAAHILMWLADNRGPQSLANIARGTGFTKSLVYRVSQELESAELMMKAGNDGYQLGLAALELGAAVAEGSETTELLRDHVKTLVEQVRETVNVGVLRDADVLFVVKQEAPERVVTISHIGQRLPANCSALGKMLLTSLEDGEIRRRFSGDLPRLTSKSITTIGALLREVAGARELEYAVDYESAILGRCGMAVLLDNPQQPDDPFGLAVTVSAEGFEERRDQLLEALMTTKATVERQSRALESIVATSQLGNAST